MEIIYEQRFLKDIRKIKNTKILRQLQDKVESVEEIVQEQEDNDSIPNITGMTKLQGHDHYYRIRVGDYRLGISIEISLDEVEDIFRFVRCLHRKDIYRYFP